MDQIKAAIANAAEDDLSESFQMGFELRKGGQKNISYDFIKRVLSKMAHNGVQNDLLDLSIQQWKQSLLFMFDFARRVLSSFRYVRPMAKFVLQNLKDQYKVINRAKKPK